MPPQPGVFALPYASTHTTRTGNVDIDMNFAYHRQSGQPQSHHHSTHPVAGPSSRVHVGATDDPKKDKKRKEVSGRLGKEMSDRRDDGRQFTETISALHSTALQLSTRPSTYPLYILRLYPLSLERSALLSQLSSEEKHALECVQNAYEEERERVEEEWKRGRDRIRERLVEGIEERRRRAREEKEGEGTVGDPSLDSQSRSHITRKLRNKLDTSPPPTPLGGHALGGTSTPLTAGIGPFTNPHSLSVDELPSPFPFPLTSVVPQSSSGGGGGGGQAGSGANGGRRRAKAAGFHGTQAGVGGLGKSLAMLNACKESEIETDLGEIRRGNKRRRVTATTAVKIS